MRIFPPLRRSLAHAAAVVAEAKTWTQDVWHVQCSRCGNTRTMLARRPRRDGACSHRCAVKLRTRALVLAHQVAPALPEAAVTWGRRRRRNELLRIGHARRAERVKQRERERAAGQAQIDAIWAAAQARKAVVDAA